jgi:rod shape-determining protein MreD
MKRLLVLLFGLSFATFLHVVASSSFPPFVELSDLFLIAAIFHSLGNSPASGMIGGSISGLLRDALSGGLYGLHGFANTLVVFASTRLEQRLVIQHPLQIGSIIMLATGLQMAILTLLQFLLVPDMVAPELSTLFARMVSNGAIGILAFIGGSQIRKTFERWRERRSRRLAFSPETRRAG